MKLTKLYTLSQFVDLMESKIETSGLISPREEFFDNVCEYNDFLKQPLKKEMFVNEIEKPYRADYHISNELIFEMKYEAWQESEKKIIFKGWQQSNAFKFDVLLNGVIRLDFSNYDFPKLGMPQINGILLTKTMNDLSDHTNGEIELKNIEI